MQCGYVCCMSTVSSPHSVYKFLLHSQHSTGQSIEGRDSLVAQVHVNEVCKQSEPHESSVAMLLFARVLYSHHIQISAL